MINQDYISVDTSVHFLDAENAWKLLEPKEKMYAYYFSRASWEGAKICYFQRSYESPGLHVLFRAIFSEDMKELMGKASAKGVTELEWRQLLAYAATVLSNTGNYKSFGDKKFIPQLSPEKFLTIIECSKSFESHKEELMDIWNTVKEVIYKIEPPFRVLGLKDIVQQ